MNTMVTTTVPVAIDEDVRERLERLAAENEENANRLVNAALRELLDYNEQLNASIARGLADAEAGRLMTTEELLRRLEERRKQRASR